MGELYGLELLLDLGKCDVSKFNRKHIKAYFSQLCELIDMEAHDQYFWDDFRVLIEERQTDPKTKGTTAIRFMLTSNITIHTLGLLGSVFVNIFSCKDYDTTKAKDFTVRFFGAQENESLLVERRLL